MFSTSKETKHVACARCRERKVKCDGAKPSCRRCQRHKHSCQYVRGKKQQSKSEWVQHLRTFSAAPANTKTRQVPRAVAPQASGSIAPVLGYDSSRNGFNVQSSRSPSPHDPQSFERVPDDPWKTSSPPDTSEVACSWPSHTLTSVSLSDDNVGISPTKFASTSAYCPLVYSSDFLVSDENAFAIRSSTPTSQVSDPISAEDLLDTAYLQYPSSSYYPVNGTSLPQCNASIPFNYGYQASVYAAQYQC